jgi:thioesterase domain-containing protein
LTYLAWRVRGRFGDVVGPLAVELKKATPTVRHVIEANARALRAYVPRPYPDSVVMLLSREEPGRTFCDGRMAWADLLEEGLTLRFIPGTHQNMLDEPHVAGVAATIARCLGR